MSTMRVASSSADVQIARRAGSETGLVGFGLKGFFEMEEYLFVDGGWLRELVEGISEKYFNGAPLEMDYHGLFKHGYAKTFYFDCEPPIRKSEAAVDHAARVKVARGTFSKLRRLPGCHVFLGDTKGGRQKGVDTQLAVQGLVHVFRRNNRRVTIMTGDLDFKPLVEALVLEGSYVTLAPDLRETSRELIDAADEHKLLWPGEIFRLTTRAFKAGRIFPEGHSVRRFKPSETWPDLSTNYVNIWDGTCSTGKTIVMQDTNGGDCMLLCSSGREDDLFWQIDCRDAEVLKKIVEDL
jgi:hypothetical protein